MGEPREGLRRRLHAQLEPRARAGKGLSLVNKLLVVLILLATLVGIVETEPELGPRFGELFDASELVFGLLFLTEYLARLWTAPEGRPDLPSWRCRLRFATSIWGIIDLVAVVATLLPFFGASAAVLRLLRLARIARLAKLGRMSAAMSHLSAAYRICRDELILVVAIAAGVIVAAATLLHWLEAEAQPDKFGSVARAMWWAVVTMTTIGYGDTFPVTAFGKVAAGIVAIVGVGLIALPAGIMAGALSQVMRTADPERRD